MKTLTTTPTSASLAAKYQNPTAEQQAAALKIQAAVGEKITGVTTVNPILTLGPRKKTFIEKNLRQMTSHSNSSVNQLSKAKTSNSFSVDHRFLLLTRALAVGFESQKPTPLAFEFPIHGSVNVEYLGTKVPSLKALAKRMTEANSATMQQMLNTTGINIGSYKWFKARYLGEFYQRRARDILYIPGNLNISLESYHALVEDFKKNPIRADETITLAELASNVKESLAQRRGFLMPSPRSMLKPLAIEEFLGDSVAVAELKLQLSESPAEGQGFKDYDIYSAPWDVPKETLTCSDIAQLNEEARGDGDTMFINYREQLRLSYKELLRFKSKQTTTIDEIDPLALGDAAKVHERPPSDPYYKPNRINESDHKEAIKRQRIWENSWQPNKARRLYVHSEHIASQAPRRENPRLDPSSRHQISPEDAEEVLRRLGSD